MPLVRLIYIPVQPSAMREYVGLFGIFCVVAASSVSAVTANYVLSLHWPLYLVVPHVYAQPLVLIAAASIDLRFAMSLALLLIVYIYYLTAWYTVEMDLMNAATLGAINVQFLINLQLVLASFGGVAIVCAIVTPYKENTVKHV